MGLVDGKKGLILGVANDASIAWAIASQIMSEGGVCGFSHLPDSDDRKKNSGRVAKCIEKHPHPEKAKFLAPLDVQKDDDIAAFMGRAHEELGQIDFLLHSIAFATLDDLINDYM
jgi:enoyl-[acyl-carrier protein] reductase I